MALKPDREELHQDITWYFDTTVEAGGVAVVSTADSGGYPGGRKNVAAYAAGASGAKPIGIMLYDVVDYDVNRQHENWYKSGFQARKGMKVAILDQGWVVTNMLASGAAPSGGEVAYLGASGLLDTTQATGAPKVGRFMSSKDQDGYAKVRLELV